MDMRFVAASLSVLVALAAPPLSGQGSPTYFKASNTGASDLFGTVVALSGNTAVVGAWGEDSNATGVGGDGGNNLAPSSGAAYVFVRSGSSWIQQAYLKASNTGSNAHFGWSVAVSGDTVVVGAPRADNLAGAAYVFVRDGSNWTQQALLKPSNTESGDHFGWSVAASGDTVVVSASTEDSSATGVNGNGSDNNAVASGAAYVFVRSGTSWSQQAYLKASNTGGSDAFGYSVSLAGDTVVVGAPQEDSNTTGVNGSGSNDLAPESGSAYVFVRNGSSWSQQAYLKASNTETLDFFGYSVGVDGDTVVAGAFLEDSVATGVNGNSGDNSAFDSGAAYVFERVGTGWTQQAYLKDSSPAMNTSFGEAVAISSDAIIIGTDEFPNRAYVFLRQGGAWTGPDFLEDTTTPDADNFGRAVAVSGNMAVVGAPGEASHATGVDGDETDNSAPNSGAAYAFELDLPWNDLGAGKPGTGGLVPLLEGSGPLTAGSANSLELTQALPGTTAHLVFGLSVLNAPFKGGTLVPYPDLILVGLAVDGSGAMTLPFTWPSGAPAGVSLWFQCWVTDAGATVGLAASNGLRGESQ